MILKNLKPWLRGGLLGLTICFGLFIFYVFAYFPIIDKVYGKQGTPTVALILPTVTGHTFSMFSGFIVPSSFLCELSETTCTGWQAENPGYGEPWQLETGEQGYCTNKTKVPTTQCAEISEKVGFFGVSAVLFLIYFGIGAVINNFLQKRK